MKEKAEDLLGIYIYRVCACIINVGDRVMTVGIVMTVFYLRSGLRQYYDPITYVSCPNALPLQVKKGDFRPGP